jgi:hypothetical protein
VSVSMMNSHLCEYFLAETVEFNVVGTYCRGSDGRRGLGVATFGASRGVSELSARVGTTQLLSQRLAVAAPIASRRGRISSFLNSRPTG